MGGFIARVTFALITVGSALTAYRYAEVAVLRANAPLEAVKIVPQDAKALAKDWGGRFDNNPELKPSADDLIGIRNAVSAHPLEPKLLSIMGLAYEASGETRLAQEVMQIANRVSRRDGISGLYLIENASDSGDVKATLNYYNTVLLTQPNLYGALLPILASAITYPEIRKELRPYLQDRAAWMPAFLTVAAEKGSVIDLQALILPLPQMLPGEESAPIYARILHRIVIEGNRASALSFAVATIPGLSAASLSSFRLDAATLDKRLGQFAWTFPPVDGIQTEIGGDGSLQINSDPLARGTVAIRDLLLDPGSKYHLYQRLQHSSGTARIDARWAADCINETSAVRFWEQRLPAFDAPEHFRSELTVPYHCKLVRISLFVEGPDGQLPATIKIDGLAMSK